MLAWPSRARSSSFIFPKTPSSVAPRVLSGLLGSRAMSIWPPIDQSMSFSTFHWEVLAFSYRVLSCLRSPFS